MSCLTNVTIGLRSVDLDTASDEAMWAQDRIAVQNRTNLPVPPPLRLTGLQKAAIEYHEAGHAFAAYKFGAKNITVRSRGDGSGQCISDKIENTLDAITLHVAGPISEALFMPSHIHKYTDGKSYDFMTARLLIEEFNTRAKWPVLTCARAAETAVEFVKNHWANISDLALALSSAGELSDTEIRLFSSCRR